MVKRKYILSAVAAALLAASPLSFAAPFGTFGAFGANPGVGRPFTGGAFNSSPGFFGGQGRVFGSVPGAGTSIIGTPGVGSSWIGSVGSSMPGSSVIGSVGSTIPGSSIIGSVGSTIPGSSVIGSVGSTIPGSSSIGSVGSMPGFSATNPGAIGTSPTCMLGLAANPC